MSLQFSRVDVNCGHLLRTLFVGLIEFGMKYTGHCLLIEFIVIKAD